MGAFNIAYGGMAALYGNSPIVGKGDRYSGGDKPDLGDLTGQFDVEGNPLYRRQLSNTAEPADKAAAYEELETKMATARNGDLTGVKKLPWNLEGGRGNEQQTADFVSEFYGDPNVAFPELDPEEYDLVYKAAETRIETAAGWRDVEANQQREASINQEHYQFADDLYQMRPDLQGVPERYINAAGQRAVQNMWDSGRVPLEELRTNRAGFIQEVITEVEYPSDRYDGYGGDRYAETTRTGGIAGGSSYARAPKRERAEPTREQDAFDFANDVKTVQKRGGWY